VLLLTVLCCSQQEIIQISCLLPFVLCCFIELILVYDQDNILGKRRCDLFVIYSALGSRKEKCPTVKESIVRFALQYLSRLLLCPVEGSLDGHP